MRIEQIQIQRYRAFDRRAEIPLKNLTVLTGPNNLGKSTVLNALELFFSVFEPRTSFRLSRGVRYSYENDYPKRYEGASGRRWPTQICVRLVLDEEDLQNIALEQGESLPRAFDVKVEFKVDDAIIRPNVDISDIETAAQRIAVLTWLRNSVRYVYIPAARNVHDFRRGIFGELISGAINRVRRSKQRLQALEKLFDDVKTEIELVERELVGELRQYLPSINQLNFSIEELDLDRLITVNEVEINDGAKTLLQHKGDGFKSLFAISLLQYIAKQRYGKNLIFGIEEPEAHLHSSAIYEIKSTLRDLAKSFQVLITTHSPILIQRDEIPANIIVESAGNKDFASTTKPATNLSDIRKSLGIRPHENMTTAEVALVVEGACEERIVPVVLARIDERIRNAFVLGRVRVISASGAANIPGVVRSLSRDATSCLVLVDSDSEGSQAADRVRGSGFIQPNDLFRIPEREGCPETEFEDLFDPSIYIASLCEATGLVLTVDEFIEIRRQSGGRGALHKKWSQVMAMVANEQSIDWNSISMAAKEGFASAVISGIEQIPHEQLTWIRAISARVVAYLNESQN